MRMHTALYLLSMTFYSPTLPCAIGLPRQVHALIVSYVSKCAESVEGLHNYAFVRRFAYKIILKQ